MSEQVHTVWQQGGNQKSEMAANFARRLERLEQLIRAQNRANEAPLYFRLDANENETAARDRLTTEGKVAERDRERVLFIVRTIVSPSEVDEAPFPAATPAEDDIFGADTRRPERFTRALEYPN